MEVSPFVHLGARSEVSLGESIAKVEELCWEAAIDNQGYLALTDANSMARLPVFAATAVHSGLKPVFGAEVDFLPFGELQYRGVIFRMRFLVEDIIGWRNLVRLVNHARSSEGTNRPPYTTFSQLLEDARGLLIFFCGTRGEIQYHLRRGDFDRVSEIAGALDEAGALERSFLEIVPPVTEEEWGAARRCYAAASHFRLLPVLVPRVSCAHPSDAPLLRLLNQAREEGALPPRRLADLLPEENERHHLLSRRTVWEEYGEFRDALEITLEIAQHCSRFAIPQPSRRFPVHDFCRGVDAESFIWNTAFARATERYGDLPTRYKERLDREFREIVDAGLANAVVTLTRLTEEMEAAGVQRGPGSGLFTNSLVASLLGLTRLDPLKFDLNFEIQPGLTAGSFPLLELSVPENQQAGAVDALQRMFEGQVIPIGEWKTWRTAQAAEHLGTLLGYDARWGTNLLRQPGYRAAKEAAATQPATYIPPAESSLESPEVFAWLVRRLEGRVRELDILSGHFTFSVDPVSQTLPQRLLTFEDGKGLPLSEWSSAELGTLRHGRIAFRHPPLLDLIGEATAMAREQGDFEFSPEQTPTDDPTTYRLLREGRTAGILPLESPVLRRRLRQGQPSDLHTFIKAVRTSGGEGEQGETLDFPTILLCHVCASIKARHPVPFFAAALSQANGEPRRMGLILEEVRERGIQVEALHVNYSSWRWTVERQALRPGFVVVRALNAPAGQEIVRKRRELHFADLTELCQRTDKALLRANHLRALLHSGAFDGWEVPRAVLSRQLDELFPILRGGKNGNGAGDHYTFFGQDASWWVQQYGTPPETASMEEPIEDLLAQEEEACVYPLRELGSEEMDDFLVRARVRPASRITLKEAGQTVSIAGMIGPLSGDPKIPDAILVDIGGCLVRARGRIGDQLSSNALAGKRAVFTGVLERETFQWKMELLSLHTPREAFTRGQTAASVTLDLSKVPEENLKPLMALLKKFPGSTPLAMEWLPTTGPRILRRIARRRVLFCPLLEAGLNRYAGLDNWHAEFHDGPVLQPTGFGNLIRRFGLDNIRRGLLALKE